MQLDPRVEKVLLTKAEITEGISKAAAFINEKFVHQNEPIIIVGILKGCIPFLGQLLPQIKHDLELDFITLSSYHGTSSTNVVKVITDLKNDIANRDVVIVEDIVDTGTTIHSLYQLLNARKPKSLTLVTLLDKVGRRKYDLHPDYTCFTIPNHYVVGYGFDFQELLRHLPYIGILKPELYTK